jgi:EAL domain-containing protein (putative c-di-GMP-specific phosphodiesterase class I)
MDEKLLSEADQALTGWSDPVARLKDALQKDEFALFCQPIAALGGAGGFPIAEVLVRLREEETAMLPPGEFLPIFEHYGMMPQLDRWIVRHVVLRLKAGSRVPGFSININARTMEDTHFPAYVATTLKAARVPPASVLFEIDEQDVIAMLPACAKFSREVKQAGCGIMIDGFGRQSVTFAMLESLMPDFVKVDGSIVRKLLKTPGALNKMNAVVRVGQAAGFGVVAECVEEPEILQQLKSLGVGYAQGFGVARPQAIEEVAAGAKDGAKRGTG